MIGFFGSKKDNVMKHLIWLFFIWLCIPVLCHSQTNRAITLNDAIMATAEAIISRFPGNTTIGIANISSPSAALSDYIIEELIMTIMDRTQMTVIDQKALNREMVYDEVNFQLTGDVSDETLVSLGNKIGAGYVITGSVTVTNTSAQLKVIVLNMASKNRQTIVDLPLIKNDRFNYLVNAANRPLQTAVSTPFTATEWYERGWQHYTNAKTAKDQGNDRKMRDDLNNAIADFSQVLRMNPQHINALGNRSLAYSMLDNYTNAIDDCSEMLRINPNFYSAYFNRSIYYSRINEYEKALADIVRLQELSPLSPEPHHLRGRVYNYQGRYTEAIESLSIAISIETVKTELEIKYHDRGNVYAKINNWTNAIADFTNAININPNSAFNYFKRGGCYLYGTDNYNAAVADFERAVRLAPNNMDYRGILRVAQNARDAP